jgi:DNA polymerase-1
LVNLDYLLEKYHIKLHLNKPLPHYDRIAIDVETDEQDNFVGIALCGTPGEVYYYTDFKEVLLILGQSTGLIGHNVKADIAWLRGWGVPIDTSEIYADTMIMSYVVNPTRPSQGLKDIAKDLLKMTWPTYKEMTHTLETVMVGKKNPKPKVKSVKLTLDKVPVENVAIYCGLDAVASFRLWQFFNVTMNVEQKRTFVQLEMPIYRILVDMENTGLKVDVVKLQEMSKSLRVEIGCIEVKASKELAGEIVNFRSPKQVLAAFKMLRIPAKSTDRRELGEFKDHPFVQLLDQHRGLSKLLNSYVTRMLETPTCPIMYPTFSQVSVNEDTGGYKGIRTGRLSSDYHNIPRRSEKGALLRGVFIPKNAAYQIVCGDYSQIEYVLLAHFSGEPVLIETFKRGGDVHEAAAKMLGSDSRDLGKLLNFSAVYGCHAKKVVLTASQYGVTLDEEQADELLKLYWKRLPRVASWISRVKYEARQRGGVRTLYGRFIPIPELMNENPYERWHAERQAVNYRIQGSAADIIKLAMIGVDQLDYKPILQVHDELLWESDTPETLIKYVKPVMENVVKLSVPLTVDFGYGPTWQAAKGA